MAVKLVTELWRERKIEEKQEFEAGLLPAEDCCMDELFPDEFIERTEILLKQFSADIESYGTSSSDFNRVMKSIENLVLGLNQINDDFDDFVIETGEREELCAYIDAVIVARDINVEELARSQGCDRYESTDQWRDW